MSVRGVTQKRVRMKSKSDTFVSKRFSFVMSTALWKKCVVTSYTFPLGFTLSHLMYAIMCIRENDKSDPNMAVERSTEIFSDKHMHYTVWYIVPEFMRFLFKMKKIRLVETIKDMSTHPENPYIESIICRHENKTMNLETHTIYSVNSNKQVDVKTTVTITLPFHIPEILHPPLRMWTTKKSNDIRELELKYLRKLASEVSTTL